MKGQYHAYIFDLDGTLYRGEDPIPGAADYVRKIVNRGARVFYATNNSSKTREQVAQKLMGMGFPAQTNDVLSSGYTTARHLSKKGQASVFVVGEPGLVQTLREHGLKVVNADEAGRVSPTALSAEYLVVGLCKTALSYDLLDAAMQVGLKGAEFLATNADMTFPLEAGKLSPGAGSIVELLKACIGREPIVVGKPNPRMILDALWEHKISAQNTLVVGDRMDTDVVAGKKAGCDTALVLSGVTVKPPADVISFGSVVELP